MKAEVLKIYPMAECYWTSRGWRIINAAATDDMGSVLGRTERAHVPEDEAWADAWRRIQRERSESK